MKAEKPGNLFCFEHCFRKIYKFDAMLSVSKQKYANRILEEIDRDFGYMLQEGATTFWETIKGEADFCGAGSLCHGWSALPICYYRILMDGEDIKSFLLQQNDVIPSTMYNINR